MTTLILTALAMLAFAGNSIICRLALASGSIDPASFTMLRVLSGAAMLWLMMLVHRQRVQGNWPSATALLAYAGFFSAAYMQLSAATGALLLFGAVQVTMIGYGLSRGERLSGLRLAGFLLAAAGVLYLLLPGLSQPPLVSSLFMLAAGVATGDLFPARQGYCQPGRRHRRQLHPRCPAGHPAVAGAGAVHPAEAGWLGLGGALRRTGIRYRLRAVVCRTTLAGLGHGGHGAAQRAADRRAGWGAAAGRGAYAEAGNLQRGDPRRDCAGGTQEEGWSEECGGWREVLNSGDSGNSPE